MKYYLIAGEKSGDMHAANLIKALRKEDKDADFRGWGGDRMEEAGLTLVKHIRESSVMGFLEVAMKLRKILRLIKLCKADIAQWKPDVVILVDYAGFNLRIAAFTHAQGIQTYYYISPKVWAWNTKRAYKIKRLVDRMFVIMHFEQAFYKQFDFEVDYVGNPLFDTIKAFQPNTDFRDLHGWQGKKLIALLPGSRKQELRAMLPIMVNIAEQFPDYQFVVAGVSELDKTLYLPAQERELPIVFDDTYNLLYQAEAAIVTSGTATLETALLDVPQVVVYKTSPISYQVAKALIKVPYISLVNLIAQKEAVKELIQGKLRASNLANELDLILGKNREKVLEDYRVMKAKIDTEGTSQRAAKLMFGYLSK